MKLALVVMALCIPTAALADRPATPNQERSQVVGPHAIRISWRDSTVFSTNSFRSGGPDLNFEVEALTPNDHSSGYLHFDDFNEAVSRVYWDAKELTPGVHCFQIWSRDPNSDMRSGQPSARTCATIPNSRPANFAARPPFGAIMPMRDQIVWFHHDGLGIQDKANDGFVMIDRPGYLCPAPWRDVVYQNGGFAGLGGASAREAADPYWLCWSALMPGGARMTNAPLPAPPVRR